QVIEPPFDVDDSAVGFIRFAGRVNLVLHASWAEHRQPQDDLIHLELQGTNGTVILNVPNYRTEDTLRFYTEVEGEPVIVTPTVKATPLSSHVTLVLDAVRSLREGTEPTSTGEQGLQAIQILEAIYQSAQSGHEIALDAVTKSAGD
ncbi:MAG TPA: Gfo/Idh/MocA family oxidoreductase, partial [Aggregatilineales bacterium]|nr:Gfo/Idh/MocA family oxidoreductase [Aggregatilineales bacterium]